MVMKKVEPPTPGKNATLRPQILPWIRQTTKENGVFQDTQPSHAPPPLPEVLNSDMDVAGHTPTTGQPFHRISAEDTWGKAPAT